MTEQLPITITVDNALTEQFLKIASVVNKLEAQFNFHTLMANWYGDEEQILSIQLVLQTPERFKHDDKIANEDNLSKVQTIAFSDDSLCYVNENEQQLLCYIAITESELELLMSLPKLLAGFLHKKLHKILNLIAQQQKLPSI